MKATRSMRRKAKQEEHTIMIHIQVLHQRMIRKPTFVSWQIENQNLAV